MAESRAVIISPDDVRTATFDTTRWRVGYDTREVDELLDGCAAELDLPVQHRTLTAEQIGQKRFRTGRPGYVMQDVDDFLDLVAGQFAADAGELPTD